MLLLLFGGLLWRGTHGCVHGSLLAMLGGPHVVLGISHVKGRILTCCAVSAADTKLLKETHQVEMLLCWVPAMY